jgi:hypothetical protein
MCNKQGILEERSRHPLVKGIVSRSGIEGRQVGHGTQVILPKQQLKNIPAWRRRGRQVGHRTLAILPKQQLKNIPAWLRRRRQVAHRTQAILPKQQLEYIP